MTAGKRIWQMICAVCAVVGAIGCQAQQTTFNVRIENISGTSNTPTPFAPGVFAVHDQSFSLFVDGAEDGGYGLESLAEDGNPAQLESYVGISAGVFDYGTFASPFQDENIGPLFPGEGVYEFTFVADNLFPYLSFVTKFLESNDLFFAPNDSGIKLFRFGAPISGDITRRILLWDAYTEINEAPGQGVYQAPRQTSEDSGPSETGPVSRVNDRFVYPNVNELIRVTITPQ